MNLLVQYDIQLLLKIFSPESALILTIIFPNSNDSCTIQISRFPAHEQTVPHKKYLTTLLLHEIFPYFYRSQQLCNSQRNNTSMLDNILDFTVGKR